MSDDTPAVTSMSETLKERPVDLPLPSGLSADEAQDVSIEQLGADLKQLQARLDRQETQLRRLPRLFAIATGLDPEMSVDLLEELLTKLVKDTPGDGSPNKGADAIASLLKGKLGGERTGAAALLSLVVYIICKMSGVPVP